MNLEECEPIRKERTWIYPWIGILFGIVVGILIGHPLSMRPRAWVARDRCAHGLTVPSILKEIFRIINYYQQELLDKPPDPDSAWASLGSWGSQVKEGYRI
jgi:hypothetical protein